MTEDMPGTVDIQDFINARKLSGFLTIVLVLCFLVVAVDGFGTAAVGDVEPTQVAQWKVTRPQLAPLFGTGIGIGGSQSASTGFLRLSIRQRAAPLA